MHQSGELLEQYNNRRKANITLLSFSIVAVVALGYLEALHLRRLPERKGYGGRRDKEDREKEDDGLDSTSIYSSSKTVDDWKGNKNNLI